MRHLAVVTTPHLLPALTRRLTAVVASPQRLPALIPRLTAAVAARLLGLLAPMHRPAVALVAKLLGLPAPMPHLAVVATPHPLHPLLTPSRYLRIGTHNRMNLLTTLWSIESL